MDGPPSAGALTSGQGEDSIFGQTQPVGWGEGRWGQEGQGASKAQRLWSLPLPSCSLPHSFHHLPPHYTYLVLGLLPGPKLMAPHVRSLLRKVEDRGLLSQVRVQAPSFPSPAVWPQAMNFTSLNPTFSISKRFSSASWGCHTD